MIKVLRVCAYKDCRTEADYGPDRHDRGVTRLTEEGGNPHDIFACDDSSKAINGALKLAGYTSDQVISVSVVPFQINQRDPGSTDFYVFLRV